MTAALRYGLIIAACVMLPAAWCRATQPDITAMRKQDSVRHALSQLGRPMGDSAFTEAVLRAASVEDVRLDMAHDTAVVHVYFTGYLIATYDMENEGRRLVIDIHNAIGLNNQRRFMSEADSLVRQMSVQLDAVEPLFVTRVAIELNAPGHVVMRRLDDHIEFRVSMLLGNNSEDGAAELAICEAHRVLCQRQAEAALALVRMQESWVRRVEKGTARV